MDSYLALCFEYLVIKSETRCIPPVMIYLCSTHFMSSFIKKVKKITKKEEESISNHKVNKTNKNQENEIKKKIKKLNISKNKKAIIFCFTLLQNASSLEEFNLLLENIYNFFNQPRKNIFFFKSKLFIERAIANRNLKFDINFATTQSDRERSETFSKFKSSETKENKKKATDSYKASSPWTSYYSNMITEFQKTYRNDPKLEMTLELNVFWRPDMFKLITNLLYLTPVWSGIFIAVHFELNKGKKKQLL